MNLLKICTLQDNNSNNINNKYLMWLLDMTQQSNIYFHSEIFSITIQIDAGAISYL